MKLADDLRKAERILLDDGGLLGNTPAFAVQKAIMIVEAADRLRHDTHHVTFTEEGWALEHSLQCRVDGMLNCQIDRLLRDWGDDGLRGRFMVMITDGDIAMMRDDSRDPAAELIEALDA